MKIWLSISTEDYACYAGERTNRTSDKTVLRRGKLTRLSVHQQMIKSKVLDIVPDVFKQTRARFSNTTSTKMTIVINS